jgi:Na+-translocating ferredoxin:NAD+ oxidoreductase RnfE subunit
MKKNSFVFLFALCPLIPASVRLSYGIILCCAFIWLFLTGLLFREIVRKINPGNAGPYIELVCIAGSATLFNLVLQWMFPVLFLSLDFYVYLTAFSFILLVSIDFGSLKNRSLNPVVPFIPVLLVFSAIRELMGFGTLSFPVRTGFMEIVILPDFSRYGLGFWGTAGGAFILLGMVAWLSKFLRRKASLSERNS